MSRDREAVGHDARATRALAEALRHYPHPERILVALRERGVVLVALSEGHAVRPDVDVDTSEATCVDCGEHVDLRWVHASSVLAVEDVGRTE